MSENRILVTGAGGQVGGCVARALASLGRVRAPGRERLDLTKPASIRATMREMEPRWVVNAAAYTAVDKAESEPELAFAVNSEAPRVIGEEARRIGAAVIHFSTDYVFDGTGADAYVETDSTAPLNVYGASKLAGEQALGASGAASLIFRTSWVYGATGKNFLLSILRMARERERLRIVADQRGAPTWSRDLAGLVAHAIAQVEGAGRARGCNAMEAAGPLSGVYHAAGAGETTWHGFASAAVDELRRRDPGVRLASIDAISTQEYPTPARRPLNSRLNCGKLERVLGWRMVDWRESLARVMAEVIAAGSV